MSILFILGAATLLVAPYEAYSARKNTPRVKVYRKPDPPKRHKKSSSTYHSNELSRLYLF